MPAVQFLGRGRHDASFVSRPARRCSSCSCGAGSRTSGRASGPTRRTARTATRGRGPHAIFFWTYVPNNHALFNLLSWVTHRLRRAVRSRVRFWSVVPGIVAVRARGVVGVAPARTDRGDRARRARNGLAGAPRADAAGPGLRACDARGGRDADRGGARQRPTEQTRDVVVFAAGALVGTGRCPCSASPPSSRPRCWCATRACAGDADRRVGSRRGRRRSCSTRRCWRDIVHNADQEFGARLAVVGMVTGVYHQLAAPDDRERTADRSAGVR